MTSQTPIERVSQMYRLPECSRLTHLVDSQLQSGPNSLPEHARDLEITFNEPGVSCKIPASGQTAGIKYDPVYSPIQRPFPCNAATSRIVIHLQTSMLLDQQIWPEARLGLQESPRSWLQIQRTEFALLWVERSRCSKTG